MAHQLSSLQLSLVRKWTSPSSLIVCPGIVSFWRLLYHNSFRIQRLISSTHISKSPQYNWTRTVRLNPWRLHIDITLHSRTWTIRSSLRRKCHRSYIMKVTAYLTIVWALMCTHTNLSQKTPSLGCTCWTKHLFVAFTLLKQLASITRATKSLSPPTG